MEKVNVEELYALAQDRTVSGRSSLVDTVTEALFGGDRIISEAERTLMTDILIQVVRDVEQSVRAKLAERLSDRVDAPQDVIRILANDQISVAEPILMKSRLLLDAELIEIIHLRSQQHRLAIVAREDVSEDISDVIVSMGEVPVVTRLLENRGACLSTAAMKFLVEESETVEVYRQPLLLRDELSPELAGRMYRWVSAALRKHILQNFKIDQSLLDEATTETLDGLLGSIRDRARRGSPQISLREVLSHANALNPEFLTELLREGQVSLFEGLFVVLTGLPRKTALRFIYEPGGETFAIACKAIEMSKEDFVSVFVLGRRARPEVRSPKSGEMPRAIAVFDRVPRSVAKAVIERWRYDPDYLSLIGRFPLKQFETLEAPDRKKSA